MLSYDYFEAIRNTNQWLGATAKAAASHPAISAFPNPSIDWVAAWGEVTERSFERMAIKPDWGIDSITCYDGRDHLVEINRKIIFFSTIMCTFFYIIFKLNIIFNKLIN